MAYGVVVGWLAKCEHAGETTTTEETFKKMLRKLTTLYFRAYGPLFGGWLKIHVYHPMWGTIQLILK